jgi:speckle-type POZ protein
MAALLASGDGADVTFTFAADADAERVQAHSFIMAARSESLRQQLRGPLASAPPHVLTVPESIAPHTFKRLLSFLYTDDLTTDSHVEAQQLLLAAEHYGVPRLRAIAECALQKGLTPQNAIAALTFAHRGGFHELRSAALRFVAAHMRDVLATPLWSKLCAEQPALIEAVLHTVAHGEPPAPAKLQ